MQSQVLQRGCGRRVALARRIGRAPGAPRHVLSHTAVTDKVSVSGNGATGGDSAAINMMNLDELAGIIKMVHETDIVEFELKSKHFNLNVKKKEALQAQEVQVIHAAPQQMQMMAPPPMAMPAPAAPAAPAPVAAAPAPAAKPIAAAPPAKVEGVEVCSPMTGTLYRCPAPGEPPFVKEGDKVTKGQTVCLIEAMKLMNEIEAETSGTVVKFLAESGKPVTPGQPLLVIKP